MSGILQGLLASFSSVLAQELYSWGSGSQGRLGDGTTENRSSPVQIGAFINWAQVEAGGTFAGAVALDGSLWMWGAGSSGRLGTTTLFNASSPVQIGALTNWAQVSVAGGGGASSSAVKTDGTLWTWGYNGSGNLGDGTVVTKSSPVQVGALTSWAQVSVGNHHMSAIKTTGSLWAWGGGPATNNQGQTGLNDVIERSSPVQVGALTNWASVAANTSHTGAVKTDGTLWTWGRNFDGQLGIGSGGYGQRRSSPVQVGALTSWAQIAIGRQHTMAIKTTGSLWGWGDAANGRLGNGSTYPALNSPVQIGALTNWRQVTAGFPTSAAVKTDGTLWTWGRGDYAGVLGQNDNISRSSPVQVGALNNWDQVSSKTYSSAAISIG